MSGITCSYKTKFFFFSLLCLIFEDFEFLLYLNIFYQFFLYCYYEIYVEFLEPITSLIWFILNYYQVERQFKTFELYLSVLLVILFKRNQLNLLSRLTAMVGRIWRYIIYYWEDTHIIVVDGMLSISYSVFKYYYF